jgi:hypothetical protein
MDKPTKEKVFTVMGASNYRVGDRQTEDYYATHGSAAKMLLELEDFTTKPIYECACGEGHISKELESSGLKVISTDLIDRGYGIGGIDFLKSDKKNVDYHIITNPPYSLAEEFIRKALEIVKDGNKIAMFLPIRYLEGKKRRKLFDEYPPKTVYVSSGRILCAKNGNFDDKNGSAMSYAWFIWVKGYNGKTIIKWFN